MIMAGGTGRRFWPLSTPDFPKQFHDVLGTGESLLQRTFSRLSGFLDAGRIFVLTQGCYRDRVRDQLAIAEDRILVEPQKKNTAPAITYGMRHIARLDNRARVFVTPSDSSVCDEGNFVKRAREALSYADAERLITLGITPLKPETGYGYIAFERGAENLKRVSRFTEKPTLERAKAFLASGDHLWNAGIFVWSVPAFFTEIKKHAPALYRAFQREDFAEHLQEVFDSVAEQSIDYALLEKSKSVFVLPVSFGWSDLGSWNALCEDAEKDAFGNAVFGAKPLFSGARDNIVHTTKKELIISGLKDFVVVETADRLLICPKSDSQRVKTWLENLK